jgi:hypothetical protein
MLWAVSVNLFVLPKVLSPMAPVHTHETTGVYVIFVNLYPLKLIGHDTNVSLTWRALLNGMSVLMLRIWVLQNVESVKQPDLCDEVIENSH